MSKIKDLKFGDLVLLSRYNIIKYIGKNLALAVSGKSTNNKSCAIFLGMKKRNSFDYPFCVYFYCEGKTYFTLINESAEATIKIEKIKL